MILLDIWEIITRTDETKEKYFQKYVYLEKYYSQMVFGGCVILLLQNLDNLLQVWQKILNENVQPCVYYLRFTLTWVMQQDDKSKYILSLCRFYESSFWA